VTDVTTLRPLNKIAAEVYTLWRTHPPSPNVRRFAGPYLEALLSLRSPGDMYGLEYGDMIVVRFLTNAAQWRGEDARRIKAELNKHLEKFNADHQSA
jgi:hypothetical protein